MLLLLHLIEKKIAIGKKDKVNFHKKAKTKCH